MTATAAFVWVATTRDARLSGSVLAPLAATVELLRSRCPEVLGLLAAADVFPRAKGGAEAMASAFGVPFLGRVPLDPSITRACEAGQSYTAGARLAGKCSLLAPIVQRLLAITAAAAD